MCDVPHARRKRTDTRASCAHRLSVVVRWVKTLITFRGTALAIFLSIAAIGAFLLLTGSNGFVAAGGAVATIAMWLGFGWVLDRLFPEELEEPRL